MSKVRQFLKDDSHEAVICQWNEVTGSWSCSSSLDALHRYRSPQLGPFVRRLEDCGFRELRPGC